MKKLIYSLTLILLAFFAASCQQENLEPVVGGETVSYIVQIPDVIATRAVSDVFTVYYEVYRELDITDPDKTPIYSGSEAFEAGSNILEFPLQFVKNQKFIVLFWAQKYQENQENQENGAGYGISDLRNVTMPARPTANNFNLEVFAGTDKVDNCVSAANGDVKLTRPIAQINIGTTAQSLTLGTTLRQSSVVVKGLSKTYNVATKAVGIDNSTFTYTQTNVPDGTFPVNGVNYNYVAMNYVGFATETGDNVDIDLVIKTSEANEILHKISNVPVKPNYKTNIVGNLITATADYDVSFNDIWAPEENNAEVVTVSDAADLQEAINNIQTGTEGNIKLEGDIVLGALAGLISAKADEPVAPRYGLLIPEGKSLILDLNGCTISQEVQCTASYSMIENNGTLTIADSKSNGKISFKDTGSGDSTFGWGSYTISNNGNLVVNGGTIEHIGQQNTPGNVVHMYCAIQQNNANAVTTINGGTISTPTYRSIRISRGSAHIKGGNMVGQVWAQPADENVVLNIEYGNFRPSGVDMSSVFIENDSRDVTFAVTGGFFSTKIGCSLPDNLAGTVTGGTFTALAKENTPAPLYAGYQFVQDGENYILERLADVAKIGETGYYSLQAAVNAVQDGETITILNDLTNVACYYNGTASFTLNLNGKTLTSSDHTHMFEFNWNQVAESTPVTINITNGTLISGENTKWTIYSEDTNNVKGTFNLTNLTIDHNMPNYGAVVAGIGNTFNAENVDITTSYGIGFYAAGGEVVMKDCSAAVEGLHVKPYNSMAFAVCANGKMTINSGEYSATPVAESDAYNQGTSHGSWCGGIMNSGGTLIIYGGTFSNDNFGDNTLATAARGLLLADTGAKIEIHGGTFNALKKVVDIQNNLGDASKNPTAILYGGNYSSNPLTWEGLISVAEGYVVKENIGKFTVEKFVPTAKVGNTEYGSIDEAIANWTNNTTLTLLTDVTLTDVVTLKSTEHHILDLGTYTMTAASGKNAIEIVPEGAGAGTAAKSCLTINADVVNPGSINAGSKACVYYKKTNGINDRIMVTINGGVFNGTISSSSNNGGQACPYFVFNGGVFNKSISLTKAMLKVTGGIFHSMFSCTGDSTAHRLISGGTFKSWTFMTADAANKFCVGTAKETYNVGVYVNKDGYLVVGGPVITEAPADNYEKKSYTSWNSYLKYSSAAEYGLYYEK